MTASMVQTIWHQRYFSHLFKHAHETVLSVETIFGSAIFPSVQYLCIYSNWNIVVQ